MIKILLFASFGVQYIPQEVSKQNQRSATHNIYIIQTDDSDMWEFYFIAFIEYMIAENTLLDYINLVSIKRIIG